MSNTIRTAADALAWLKERWLESSAKRDHSKGSARLWQEHHVLEETFDALDAALKGSVADALPTKGCKVRILDKEPIAAAWRGVEAMVLAEAILPESAHVQVQRLDTEETGIIDVSNVVVIEEAPPKPIATPLAIWLTWAKAEIETHQKAIVDLENAIRKEVAKGRR